MSDQPPTSPAPPTGGGFCAECGAAMPADARFCGSCGAPPPGAAAPPAGGADPTVVSGASSWQGVAPVVERPTEAIPPVPPGPAGPPPVGPPVGGPPPAPPSEGKGKGAMVAVIVVVLALLAGGAFFLLGGDDDGDEDVAAQDDEETTTTEADDEETTTTEADDEVTTTTEADDVEATTTAPEVVDGGLTFAQAQDDTGRLVVEVPDFWQLNGAPLGDGSPNIIAASDINGFVNGFQSSGVSYTLLPGANADPDAVIDFLTTSNNVVAACTAEPREDYSDGVFTGRRQVFTNCEGRGLTIVDVVGTTAEGVSVDVTMALVPEDPFDIVTHIEQTFNLTS